MLSGIILSKHIFTGSCTIEYIPEGTVFLIMGFLLVWGDEYSTSTKPFYRQTQIHLDDFHGFAPPVG
jgi:hypothetical protein